jgi:hypothetical protein
LSVTLYERELGCKLVLDRPRWDTQVPVGKIAKKATFLHSFEPLKIIAFREKANFAGCDLNEFAPLLWRWLSVTLNGENWAAS